MKHYSSPLLRKGKVCYGQEPSSGVSTTTERGVNYLSTACSNATEVAQGLLPVAVDHSQIRTMASERIDSIDLPLPPPFTGKYLRSSNCLVQMEVTNHKICCRRWEVNTRPSECQANILPMWILGYIFTSPKDYY